MGVVSLVSYQEGDSFENPYKFYEETGEFDGEGNLIFEHRAELKGPLAD